MRTLKLFVVMALAMAFAASAAFAGGTGCCTSGASAASATCTAHQASACSGMSGIKVETTRMSSGDLVVHYIGTTPEAVTYLHANCAGSADKFCCPMTQRMATNQACKVDMSKVSNGVIVFVSSPKREVVDTYEKEFAALTTTTK